MKIKTGFVLREIAGTHVVVPIGQNVVELSIMMTLNESGAFLWNQLSTEVEKETVISAMTQTYGINTEIATADFEEFVSTLIEKNLMDLS